MTVIDFRATVKWCDLNGFYNDEMDNSMSLTTWKVIVRG